MFFIKRAIYFSLLVIISLFVGCSSNYQGKEIFGAEEFVLDSYKIREGKFSILELEGQEYSELSPQLLEEYKDTITDGDILNVIVYHPSRKDINESVISIGSQIGFKVVDGKISLPDIPPIFVAGLTLEQAREKIENQYCKDFKEVEIFISYKNRIVKKVELAGLVQLPSIPVDGKKRLYDVLAEAKIPPEANLFKSYFLRDGKQLPVDFIKLLKEGDMSQNIVMRGGDKIYIAAPLAASLMVMGEVALERLIDLPDGKMSLRHALAAAKGIPFTGDKSYIQVIRGNIANPKIYLLSWDHVIQLPNNSLLLMPGDIVYVASKPITEWNRFISQLLPSFTYFELFQKNLGNVGIMFP